MPKQPPPKKSEHTTVKVPTDAYAHAQRLLKKVASVGWQAFGITRTDVPTLGALIEEGLKKLDASTKPDPT